MNTNPLNQPYSPAPSAPPLDALVPPAPHPNDMARRLAAQPHFTRPEAESYALDWAREYVGPELLRAQAELGLNNTEQAETGQRLAWVRRWLKYIDPTTPGDGHGVRWPWHIRFTVFAVLAVTAAGLAFELRNIAVQLMGTLPGLESITSAVLYAAVCIGGSFAVKAVYEQLAPWWRRWVLVAAALAWLGLFITWSIASAGSFAQLAADPMDSLGGALDGAGETSLDASSDGDGVADAGATAASSSHPMVMMACMFLLMPLTALLGMSYFSHIARRYGPPEVPNKDRAKYLAEQEDLIARRGDLLAAATPLVTRIAQLQHAPERIVREALEAWDESRKAARSPALALPPSSPAAAI